MPRKSPLTAVISGRAVGNTGSAFRIELDLVSSYEAGKREADRVCSLCRYFAHQMHSSLVLYVQLSPPNSNTPSRPNIECATPRGKGLIGVDRICRASSYDAMREVQRNNQSTKKATMSSNYMPVPAAKKHRDSSRGIVMKVQRR